MGMDGTKPPCHAGDAWNAQKHAFPALRGALAGLKVVDVADLAGYRAALAAGCPVGWGYYFPFLLTHNRDGRSALLIGHDDSSVCLYRWRMQDTGPRVDLYAAPVPMNTAVLQRCFERANEFNGDRSARCNRIDADSAEMAASLPDLRVKPRKSQYLFAPANCTELAGKAYYTVRRNVQQVQKLPDLEVRPYTAADAEPCHDLLRRWRTAHRAQHGVTGGFGISRRAIDLVGVLPESVLRGEVVVLDGRIVSFAFGGELRPGLGCSFERKCEIEVRGLSFFQLRSFLVHLREYELVNDGTDNGRPGLRQLKDSFRPVRMHTEYGASQRR